MANSLDAELEQIVSRVARDLAREITGLLLRRLGLEQPAPRGLDRHRRGKAPPAAQPTSGPKPSARTPAPAALAAQPQRSRSSSRERAEAISHVERVVSSAEGLSAGDIERETQLPRAVVSAALKTLKDQGRLFMGGTKRFARYAKTQAVADRANLNARRARRDRAAASG